MNLVDFVTDTATLCVFDVASLHHRIEDDGDWWTLPDEELMEVNNGNVAFIGLGEDGKYTLEIADTVCKEDHAVILNCPSGRLFLGAGEEATGDGLEPEAIRGGTFLSVSPGHYRLAVHRKSKWVIAVSLKQSDVAGKNQFNAPIRI